MVEVDEKEGKCALSDMYTESCPIDMTVYMSSTPSTSDTFVETFPSHKQRVYQYSSTKFRIRFATWETSHTRTNDQRYLVLMHMSSNGQGLMVQAFQFILTFVRACAQESAPVIFFEEQT